MAFLIFCIISILIKFSQETANDPVVEYSGEDANTTFDYNEFDLVDPWETPFQELMRITPACFTRLKNFEEIAWKIEIGWQRCMESINPRLPILETGMSSEELSNFSRTPDKEDKVYMSICRDTFLFKSCWEDMLNLLNQCTPGQGDLSRAIYFALYDDICREGGRFTVETRKKAENLGMLCDRNYNTEECKTYTRQLNNSDYMDLCKRFELNVACDLSSIDPNCENEVDRTQHMKIFQRVRSRLGCYDSKGNEVYDTYSRAMAIQTGFDFVAYLVLGIVYKIFLILRT